VLTATAVQPTHLVERLALPPTAKFDQTVFGSVTAQIHAVSGPQDGSWHSALPFHLFDAFLKRRVLAANWSMLRCSCRSCGWHSVQTRSLTDMPWLVRSLVSRVALERGWHASALRLLDVVKLSVEVR
jgi:hypothetical protein